jgi:ATP-dependent Zn protease
MSDRTGHAVANPLPATATNDGPEMARPYVNDDHVAYHEAGHAVAFWYYGVTLQCVTMKPPDDSGHRAQTVPVDRGEITGVVELENEMKCAAAGEIAQTRFFVTHRVRTDRELIGRFTVVATKVTTNPDLPDEDDPAFAKAGLARDEEIRETCADAVTGPAGWLRVWREAEQLIRVELWPAVRAVADELIAQRDLTGEEVAALASAAMEGHET